MARRPNTRETITGTKQNKWQSTLTQSIGRWLVLKHIEPWDTRQKTGRKKQRVGARKLDDHGHEAFEGQHMLPGLDLDSSNSDASNHRPDSSPGSSIEEEGMSDLLNYGQHGTIFPVLSGNDFGAQGPFAYDPYAFFSNAGYPPSFPKQSSIEVHDQPQNYDGPTFPLFDTASADDFYETFGISSNTRSGIFDGAKFASVDEMQAYRQNTSHLLGSPQQSG